MDTLLIYQSLPDMIPIVIWEGQLLERCIERTDDNYLSSEYADQFATGEWQTGTKGCIKKKGFEDGVPIWKSFVFHFWPSEASPLGHQWTLAPENYTRHDRVANYYLGKLISSALV